MNRKPISVKNRRNLILTVLCVLVVVVLLALNLLMTGFTMPSHIYVDMTPEGLYGLSDSMIAACNSLEVLSDTTLGKPIEIIFCSDPDYLLAAQTTRIPYVMALELERRYDNVRVKTVNATYNPTALAKYKTTSFSSISQSDIVVAYGNRYRVVSADSFWTTDTDTGNYFSYNGEYKMMTLLLSLTYIGSPVAYFVSGHGESVYDPDSTVEGANDDAYYFAMLLYERGLQVKTIDLNTVDEVPDDCALLIINNPTDDFVTDDAHLNSFYYQSELEKIDRYLTQQYGALIVAKDYSVSLPQLESYLYEWGFSFSDADSGTYVTDVVSDIAGNTTFTAVYNTEQEGYAHAVYGDITAVGSAPRVLISNTGYVNASFGSGSSRYEPGATNTTRTVESFLYTSDVARAVTVSGETELSGTMTLAAVSVRYEHNSYTDEGQNSYVFCVNSADFFSSRTLQNAAYANYDVISLLVDNMSRSDVFASIDIGGTSFNSSSYGGKQLVSVTLNEDDTDILSANGEIIGVTRGISTAEKTVFCIIIMSVPLAVAVAGIAVRIKRRYK